MVAQGIEASISKEQSEPQYNFKGVEEGVEWTIMTHLSTFEARIKENRDKHYFNPQFTIVALFTTQWL